MATYNAFTSIKKKYTTTPTNSSSLYKNAYSTPTSNANTGVYSGYTSTIKPASTVTQQQQAAQNIANQKTATQPKTTSTYNAFQPSTANSAYEEKMKKLYADQQAQLAQQKQQNLESTNRNYDYAKQYYEASVPMLQDRFSAYEANANADIKAMQDSAARQKASTSNQYLSAQKDALVAQRENEARTAQEFAALGTIDSGGVGSYGRARENINSEANSYRQTNNAAMASALADIDDQLGSAERTAQQAILTERGNLESAIREINYTLGNNELARQNALNEVINGYNTSVRSIQQELATLQYTLAQKAEELQGSSLSEEFMSTGVPQNQTDYKYMVENKDYYSTLNNNTKTESSNKVKNIIDQLYPMNTKGITGLTRFAVSDSSRNAAGLLKQLSSELQIEEAKRLKGQGSMSDAERSILANSIAAFNPDKNGYPQVSDERFKQILNQLYTQLGGSNLGSSNTGAVTMLAPDGQYYSVSSSEVAEAQANGWKVSN